MIIFIGILLLFLAVHMVIETYWVRVSELTINMPSAAADVKVLQLSDLHGQTRFLNGTLSAIVNRLKPDHIMITGDLVSRLDQLESTLQELRLIKCGSVFFVPGNYEREGREGIRKRIYSEQEYHGILTALRERGIKVLSNEGCPLLLNGMQGFVYGFDNSIYGNERLTISAEELQEHEFIIMLAHSPSIFSLLEEIAVPYSLLLTGHTHGGQVRLFGRTLGAYKQYHIGLKRLDGGKHFYINRGLSTVKLPIRFGSPPEVALFHIKS